MAARHVYSTEDENLSIIYHLGDTLQGGIIENYEGTTVPISVTLSDADNENLGYVYIIGENGKELYKSDYLEGNTADLSIELQNTSAYYYVKVVQADGNIAVTAPVWVGDVTSGSAKVKADVTSKAAGENPVAGKAEALSLTLTNSEAQDVTLVSYTVTVDGKEIASGNTETTIGAGTTWTEEVSWTPDTYGSHKVILSCIVKVGDETKTVTKTKSIYVQGENYTTVAPIKDAKAGKEKEEFTIEGYVTANASGYDKNTAFFDCIYVQDETAGINVFPVAGNYQVGQKVRLHGAITYYNGEIELNLSGDYGGYIEVIDETITPVSAKQVSASAAMAEENIGLLMEISGTVTRIHEASGVIDRIYVKDDSGEACVYINGYIWNSKTQNDFFGPEGTTVKVGDKVTVTGLGSVDVDELQEVEYLHRLRVRDRAEVVVTAEGSDGSTGGSTYTWPWYLYVDTTKDTDTKDKDTDNTTTITDNDVPMAETPDTDAAEEKAEGKVPKKITTVKTTMSNTVKEAALRDDGFYYDAYGKVVKNRIIKLEDGTRYILGKKGQVLTSSLVVAKDGTKYIVDSLGVVVTGKIVSTNSSKYYCAKTTGKIAVSKVVTVDGKKYVAAKSGKLVCGKWTTLGKTKYYCNKSGVVTKTKKVK
jgi:uncharacterized Zn-binding protein involved in type VI secretion